MTYARKGNRKTIKMVKLQVIYGYDQVTSEGLDRLVIRLTERQKKILTSSWASNRRNVHNWLVSELLFAGEELGYTAVPEFEVVFSGLVRKNSSETRKKRGYIDVVWVMENHPAVGFEVGFGHGDPLEIAKLQVCPVGILVLAGNRTGLRSKNIRRAKFYNVIGNQLYQMVK